MNIYTYLAIAIILGLLSSKAMEKIKFPNVTGYIIIGLIAGPYCLNIINMEAIEKFSMIPDMALGFIAFSIGAEFKLSYLKLVGKSPVIIAFAEAVSAVLIVDLILILTGNDVAFSLVLGAIAAATAPAATLMVVRQYNAKGPVTNTLLPVVAIDDAVALMCFGISVAIAKSISSVGAGSIVTTLLDPIIEIGGALIFGAILGIILKFLAAWYTGRGNRLTMAIAMVFLCIGVSELLGFSALLACMAMSAVFTNLSEVSEEVFKMVDRMTPPIYLLFFFVSGAELDITILPTVGVIGALYVIFRVIGKVSGAAIGAKISKAEPIVAKYLGFTLLPQAGVAIGLAGMATTIVPEYGYKIQTIVLCGTVIYELIGPLVTKMALTKAGEIKPN
ncbi:cation:proton antiporter [Sedimentibacter sp. MB31-C6]|uniref:cation:proton antiporter n=1 Tax=Sedimentibacter sp. MB31-C6 TaxID=3109366 RepID=UPI002DDCAAA3|nr:cation:proton antiporter [Sedimentibacter sp. MB36-C1]WSI04014.1 cation:proton antiporter [Sedimentibacter sp. MB36-C1]